MENTARQKWSLTKVAFDSLLESLNPDRDIAARQYLDIRANLVRMFEWRGCPSPDDYADEALNRCARRIAEGEPIRDVPTFIIGIARLLSREMGRSFEARTRPLEDAPTPRTLPVEPTEISGEQRDDCLRRCLGTMSSDDRDLILRYYQGEKGGKIDHRKSLSERFGLTAGTLRMRALRLRERLQLCVEQCLSKKADVTKSKIVQS